MQEMNLQLMMKNETTVESIRDNAEELLRLLQLQMQRQGSTAGLTREESMRRMNEQRASKLGITPQPSPSNRSARDGRPNSTK